MLNFILITISLLTLSCERSNPINLANSSKNEIIVDAEEDPSGVFQLFLRNIDGSKPKQLTFNQFKSSMPSISPDGTNVAYTIENGSVDIYLIKLDGTDNHKITNGGGNMAPCWTPDGNNILFSYAAIGADNFKIYKMKPDGTEKTLLVKDPCNCSEFVPTLSPDGQFVAFTSNRSGTNKYEIWKVNIAGSNLTKLTMSSYDSTIQATIQQKVPSWSPDGKKIALWRGVEMSELHHDGSVRDQQIVQSWKVCVMNADGSNLTAIDFGDDPTWSNDSKYILHPDPTNRDMNSNNQISVKRLSPDGSNNITLFKTFRNFARMDVGYMNK